MPSLTKRIPDLHHIGPIIEALIGVSSVTKDILQKEQKEIPQPITARMLVDTGASVSAIKKGVADQLGLKPHGLTKIATPSHGAHECPLYDVDILFSTHHTGIRNVRVIESAFEGQNIDGLIGRDILKLALLVYTGYDNSFTIAF
ncbi:MAG: aspartyl protease family protein [Parcubacteria group bacterium]|nr:aspartyl protease family protein [Parcubacteria group bacterium]